MSWTTSTYDVQEKEKLSNQKMNHSKYVGSSMSLRSVPEKCALLAHMMTEVFVEFIYMGKHLLWYWNISQGRKFTIDTTSV